MPKTIWSTIRVVAMNYIALAFLLDFAKFPLHDFRLGVEYLPFAGLAIIGPAIRFGAWLQINLNHLPKKLGSNLTL